jgi:hypothetical protein
MFFREPAPLRSGSSVVFLCLLFLGLGACGGDGDGGITLPATTGTLEVTTATSGDEMDPDGYTLQLDTEAPVPIGAAGSLRRTELQPRSHNLILGGLSPNCSAAENPRTVTIVAGETLTSHFEVVCTATSGGVVITTATDGASPDPDGYAVVLDGVEQGPIPASGQLALTGLTLGTHVIGLSGLAGNCELQGDNLRTVPVTPASSTPVDYAITCVAPPPNAGTLTIATTTGGGDPDPDGYSFALDGGEGQPIGANASATIINVAPGTHQVQLGGVAENCRVQGGSRQSVNVTAGGAGRLTFAVTCSRAAGTIRVSVSTSGNPADPNGYQVTLDNAGAGQHVDPDGSVRFTDVSVGSHIVVLGDIAGNCAAEGGPSRSTTVTDDETAEVQFVVACSGTSGSVVVTTATGGPSPDEDGYSVVVDGKNSGTVPSTGQATVSGLAAGSHVVELGDVAANCEVQGGNKQTVDVAAGGSTTVQFSITCTTPPPGTGSLRIVTATTGPDQDADGYGFAVDDGASQHIDSEGNVTLDNVSPGVHTVQLSGLAQNCTVEGTNPRSVTVNAGSTEEVRFNVTCSATTGSINVTTSTSGDLPDDDGYVIRLDGSNPRPIDPSGTETFATVPQGDHTVTITNVAGNCSVTGGSSRDVSVTAGQPTNVQFDITCPAPQPTTGSIRVRPSTTGDNQDEGYTVTVDGNERGTVGANGELVLSDLSEGNHNVGLSGVAENCTVADNPQPVTVTAGETKDVTFNVSCSAPALTTGSIAVTTNTSGENQDDAFTVTMDRDGSRGIGPRETVVFNDLSVGEHEVELGDIAENCTMDGENPKRANVTAGGVAGVDFLVSCLASAGSKLSTSGK